MNRIFSKKVIFILLVSLISIFTFAGVASAAQQAPLTLDSTDSFSDISSSSDATAGKNTSSNSASNAASTSSSAKKNNSTQTKTKIPQTGSNSGVYFVCGLVILAVVSLVSINLYNRIKLS